jgi:two-component system chemotaxis response regulator CheY
MRNRGHATRGWVRPLGTRRLIEAVDSKVSVVKVTVMNTAAPDTLRLPRVLDLAAAEGFLDTIRGYLKSNRPLCLDASEVETLTLPCIQIILAAGTTHKVSIVGPSDAFASAFRDLALDWNASGDGAISESVQPCVEPADEPDPTPPPSLLSPVLAGEGGEGKDTEPTPGRDQVVEQEPIQVDQTDGTSMSKRILTIDDSRTMRDMLRVTLAEAGFDVLQAVDGQDGLDVLGKERVDVVITDINMPKMDGYEVIRNLRRDPLHKTTPILVLTTESDTEKKVIARDAGATGWMVKPFDPDRLIATIRKVAP